MYINTGDSRKLQFYELDPESKMQRLKTYPHTSNRLAMEPGTREEKQLKETKTLQQGKSDLSNTCPVSPVWRGGGQKRLYNLPHVAGEAGGGQERLYDKPTIDKVLWRGEPSSIRKGTQALTRGRRHAKNPSRAIGKARD